MTLHLTAYSYRSTVLIDAQLSGVLHARVERRVLGRAGIRRREASEEPVVQQVEATGDAIGDVPLLEPGVW
jgi:hypothetical protein